MRDRIPTLRRKSNGAFFVRFDGRDHSLGSDPALAQERYIKKLDEWRRWREAVHERGQSKGRRPAGITVVDLHDRFLDSYEQEGRVGAADYFRRHLKRFVNLHGTLEVVEIATARPDRGQYLPPLIPAMESFRVDMVKLGLGNQTIRHDMGAVRTMIKWAARMGHCPAVPFDLVKMPSIPRRRSKEVRFEDLAAKIDEVAKKDETVAIWMRLNYLTACRPSEMVTLVHGRGHFAEVRDKSKPNHPVIAERGMFILDEHKNKWRENGMDRHVLLSDEALEWLDIARRTYAPRKVKGQFVIPWSRLDSYSAAVRDASGFGPSSLRDSAATDLLSLGVGSEDVDQCLGHISSSAVLRSYAPPAWHVLWRTMGRLTLRSGAVERASS